MTNKDAWKSISKTIELAGPLLCETCKLRLLTLSKQIEARGFRKKKRPGFKKLKEAFVTKYTERIQQRGTTGLVALARTELEYSSSTAEQDILHSLVRTYNKLNPDTPIRIGVVPEQQET